MFKRTKTMKFASLDYSEETLRIITMFLRDFDMAVSQQLIRRSISLSNGHLSSDTLHWMKILDEKFGRKFEGSVEAVIKSYTKDFDFPTTVQVLEAYLSYFLKDLSTSYENPASQDQKIEEEETKPKQTLTLKQVIDAHDSYNLLNFTSTHTKERRTLYGRTLFHSILAVRDRLLCTGYCDTWSARYAESWVEKSHEFLRDDLASQAAKHAVSEGGEPFVHKVLVEIVDSVCRDVVYHTRMGKRFDESNKIIQKLLAGVKDRLNTIKIPPLKIQELIELVVRENFIGLQKYVSDFIEEIFNDILLLVEKVVQHADVDNSYLPDQESPRPFLHKYGHDALLRLSAGFFSEAEDLNRTFHDFMEVSLPGRNSQWTNHYKTPIKLDEWLLAAPVKNLQVDAEVDLGDVKIVPSDKCPNIVTEYFSKISGVDKVGWNPLDEPVWVFVQRIFADSNDSERAKTYGRRKIEETLNSILVLIDNRSLYDYHLGHHTYAANTKTSATTLFNGIGSGSVKFPVNLTGDKFPVGTPWGDYLRKTTVMDSAISNRVRRAFDILASARRYEFPDQRFLRYLTCLESLLKEEHDSRKYGWLDRATLIMAGPNIPEAGYTYGQARVWLRNDFDIYLRLRDSLLQGRGNGSADRVIERIESIVVDCLINVYASLNDPDFNELDQLILWFALTRPEDDVIGGVSI